MLQPVECNRSHQRRTDRTVRLQRLKGGLTYASRTRVYTSSPTLRLLRRSARARDGGRRSGSRIRVSSSRRLLAVVSCLLLGTLAVMAFASVRERSTTSYYVDCNAGDDRQNGTAADRAWKTISRANRARLRPGNRLLLKRGCRWEGPLVAAWRGRPGRPILIGAYGTGALPTIENAPDGNVVVIRGSYQVLERLRARADAPPGDPNCENQPVGWRAGFVFEGTASYNTLRHSIATELTAGVHIGTSSHHNRVISNRLINNTYMSVNTNDGGSDDSGAWGIAVRGRSNEIAFNRFSGNIAWCSFDFGGEGASIEIYEGRNNNIHHNRSINDTTFSELGSTTTEASGNIFAYNLYVNTHDGGHFLVIRGANDPLGPTPRTIAYNNTIYLTGATNSGVSCFAVCSSQLLRLHNNILWVNGPAAYADGPFSESSNIYWNDERDPLVNFEGFGLSPSSREIAPEFVNPQRLDFRLRGGSPAIDAGTSAPLAAGYRTDLARTAVPQGARVDIGAYEYTRRN
jgi:hypothetical protein